MSAYGHSHGEHEPFPGLPEELPEGEEVLWQGSPQWSSLANRAFKLRLVAIYFAGLLALRVVLAITRSEADALAGVVLMAVLFAVGLGLLAMLALLHRRATIYTITTRRVVLRIGMALSTTWNLPFRRLASADLALHGPNDGDLILTLAPPNTIGWFHFWPHVKPGNILRAKPALRCLAAPEEAAKVLRDAVASWSEQEAALVVADEGIPDAELIQPKDSVRAELATAGGY